MNKKLYYHKTDRGAEYLTDKYILCPDGSKEGVFEGARYIIRIDGNIMRDAHLFIKEVKNKRSKQHDTKTEAKHTPGPWVYIMKGGI
jgi:hypothetical protein